ncbi:hypothetical protein OPV22_007209 [Ensete ventricosum]|uniref:Tobamovirus multiplication protein 2B n=1 Tax=Ensete ventricosum TaxID=4639 RepID=A0AAV8RU59_ENSVE|nr:hypothetical protein OPV22_007209 [Ensete ventricosum]
MAASGSGGGGGGGVSREGSAKATVADRISQAVQSTSNLLHLMQESSPSQAQLIKLPKNLFAKVYTIKNTGQVLDQLPRVISSLDAYMESSLHSAPQLKTVTQLLSHMENSQLKHPLKSSSVVCCWEATHVSSPSSPPLCNILTDRGPLGGDLQGKVGWMVAALINLEGDVLDWVAS